MVRLAGARLAAHLPSLIEDPFLTAQAELGACFAMISHYEARKQAIGAQLEKMSKVYDMNFSRHSAKPMEAPVIPREDTHIGIAMLSGELEGGMVFYTGSKRTKAQPSARGFSSFDGGGSMES